MEDIADYAAEAGGVITSDDGVINSDTGVINSDGSGDKIPASDTIVGNTLEAGTDLDEEDAATSASAKNHKYSSSSSFTSIPSSSSPSCSFSRTKPNYFLVNSPKSLSHSSFQLDNRCIALWPGGLVLEDMLYLLSHLVFLKHRFNTERLEILNIIVMDKYLATI